MCVTAYCATRSRIWTTSTVGGLQGARVAVRVAAGHAAPWFRQLLRLRLPLPARCMLPVPLPVWLLH